MQENRAIEILKSAMLLEMRGKSFYRSAAAQSSNPAIKQFFEIMAEEEDYHIKILSDQYKAFRESGKFKDAAYSKATANVASAVLNDALKEKIQSAGFESAAIQAAMAMEERAIKLYAERAGETDEPEERKLYEWLSDWENGHLTILMDMDRELTEKIWNDNQFWPF
ncbi:ferritin family protein [Desulfococcus sp.]|uniref:ferritin-like domain-containing protein n=1 Tax=Desulfococcus sp. TaxID=2025834 RepID=UPI003593F507